MTVERWHGTLNGYTYHRCRCARCSAAKRAWQRRHRLRNRESLREQDRERRARKRAGYKPGHLEVTCWCEAEVVYVSPDDLRAGRTESCGRSHCRPDHVASVESFESNRIKPKNQGAA